MVFPALLIMLGMIMVVNPESAGRQIKKLCLINPIVHNSVAKQPKPRSKFVIVIGVVFVFIGAFIIFAEIT